MSDGINDRRVRARLNAKSRRAELRASELTRFAEAAALVCGELPLSEQIAHVLDGAREVVGVDRLCLWAEMDDAPRGIFDLRS